MFIIRTFIGFFVYFPPIFFSFTKPWSPGVFLVLGPLGRKGVGYLVPMGLGHKRLGVGSIFLRRVHPYTEGSNLFQVDCRSLLFISLFLSLPLSFPPSLSLFLYLSLSLPLYTLVSFLGFYPSVNRGTQSLR